MKIIEGAQQYIKALNVWCDKSVNRRIFAAMITVGAFTVIVKLAAVCKELVVAYRFGTQDSLDAFLIALLLPSFTVSIIAGSFNSALIPTYIQVMDSEGKEAAQRLFSSFTASSLLILILFSLLLVVALPFILPFLGSGFSYSKLQLTRSLSYLLLPMLVISGLTTIWASIINASEKFALAAVAPIMTPVITVLILLMLGKKLGIYALAMGTVVGVLFEAAILGWSLVRQGFSLMPRWCGIDPALKQAIKQYIPMVAGALLFTSNTIVDQVIAVRLGSGSVASLNYGNKVITFIVGIGSIAIGTAILPHFSRMVAAGNHKGIKNTLKRYLKLIFSITIPTTIILFILSEPLVHVLFQRGAFMAKDTAVVSRIQAFYGMQIPFYIAGVLGVRLMSSYLMNNIILKIAAFNFVLNITLDIILSRYFGITGIAMATSIVYFVSTLLIFSSLYLRGLQHE